MVMIDGFRDTGGFAMRTHELKTWPEFFREVVEGRKPFEVREDDRGYAVGDRLVLIEWDPAEPSPFEKTGRKVEKIVTYKMPGGRFGIDARYCVLGLGEP